MAATKLTDKLTNIADAIREKTGESGTLTLDGMAEAIAGISAGGGGAVFVGKVAVAEDTTSITVSHGLGKTPDAVSVVYLASNVVANTLSTFFVSANAQFGASGRCTKVSGQTYTLTAYINNKNYAINADKYVTADSQTLSFNVPEATMRFTAGFEYFVTCAVSEQ